MTYSEIVHPTPDDGINTVDYPVGRLGPKAPEDFLELAQQFRPLLDPWRELWPPLPVQTPYPPKLKPQEFKGATGFPV